MEPFAILILAQEYFEEYELHLRAIDELVSNEFYRPLFPINYQELGSAGEVQNLSSHKLLFAEYLIIVIARRKCQNEEEKK